VSPEARRRFWSERARTAAIAAHTNAFKINEDVVIPLDRLAEYSEGIERINILQSMTNKLRMVAEMLECLKGDHAGIARPALAIENGEGRRWFEGKRRAATQHLEGVQARWQLILNSQDTDAEQDALLDERREDLRPGDRLIDLLLRRSLRISYKREVRTAPVGHLSTAWNWSRCASAWRPSTTGCSPAACSWPCTCTRATATCTPTSRSTPTTTP
jgi:FAD/FMN-containing dehydrogenase